MSVIQLICDPAVPDQKIIDNLEALRSRGLPSLLLAFRPALFSRLFMLVQQ